MSDECGDGYTSQRRGVILRCKFVVRNPCL